MPSPETRADQSASQDLTPAELAHQQALKYGEDLRRIYLAEKAKRQELELANQLLSAVFASTPDGLAVLNDNLEVQQVNPVFLQLIEREAGEVEGHLLEDVLPYPELLDEIRAMPAETQGRVEFEMNVEQPVRRSLLVSTARLRAGRRTGWVLSLRDQTERKRLEYQKIEFVNIAAHELRTPLSALIGLSEMVLESADASCDDDLRECLGGIYNSGVRLAHTVNELLAFAQLSRGSLQEPDQSGFSLAPFVEDMVSELASHADEKEVGLIFDPAGADIEMHVNPVLLRAAIFQLILNGINFNRPGGSVYITVENLGQQVRIQIADNGIGIPQADLDTIFHPFYQVEEHSIRRVGGLGLGLSIVQHAITQLGGEMAVESVLKVGTTFTLTLPVSQSDEGFLPAR